MTVYVTVETFSGRAPGDPGVSDGSIRVGCASINGHTFTLPELIGNGDGTFYSMETGGGNW